MHGKRYFRRTVSSPRIEAADGLYGPPLAPSIPGTKRVSRVDENTAADQLGLSADQIERLNNLTPALGERHEVAQTANH